MAWPPSFLIRFIEVAAMVLFGPLFRPNIEKMKIKRDVNGLAAALYNRDDSIRTAAARALADINDAHATKVLRDISLDKRKISESVRLAAIEALGSMKDVEARRPLLINIFEQSANLDVRLAAAYALAEDPDERTTQILVDGLGDANWYVRWGMTGPIRRIGLRAVEPLIRSLHSEDYGVREKAARILGSLGDSRAIVHLANLTSDENESVRQAANYALNQLRHVPMSTEPRGVTLPERSEMPDQEIPHHVTLRCERCGLPLVHAYSNRFYCDNQSCTLFGHIVT